MFTKTSKAYRSVCAYYRRLWAEAKKKRECECLNHTTQDECPDCGFNQLADKW
jgi:hypothetical protein